MSAEKTTYKTALKSTSLIGGASLINILISMIRIKFVAVLLGPSGVGLIGVYSSIITMVSKAAGMGISTSGVRQIAAAHGGRDPEKVTRTVKIVQRAVWLTGLCGMAVMVAGSGFFSRLSFGETDHAVAIATLGLAVLFMNLTTGKACVLQGTRRIADLAKRNILGSVKATIISIPCYYFWGMQGVAISLVLSSIAEWVIVWWFARRVPLVPAKVSWTEGRQELYILLNFGLPVMLSGFMGLLAAYVIRSMLVWQLGLDGVGIWHAAYKLSVILVSFVLAAMGTDFYPRLTAVAHDNKKMIHAVNEQTEIALLLAAPGLAATIIFAPAAIVIFYTGRFDASVEILRWSVYGILGRVISWPLGFIPLAKGMGKTYFIIEFLTNLLQIILMYIGIQMFGLVGTGIAFLMLYIVYLAMIYLFAWSCIKMSWDRETKWHVFLFTALLIAIGLVSAFVDHLWMQYAINTTLLGLLSIYCLRRLSDKSGVTPQRFLAKFLPRRNEAPA